MPGYLSISPRAVLLKSAANMKRVTSSRSFSVICRTKDFKVCSKYLKPESLRYTVGMPITKFTEKE